MKRKALLDTNIIIHRETNRILNQDIGTLFKWLEKAGYEKSIHQVTIDEIGNFENPDILKTFTVKMNSYDKLKTTAPMSQEVKNISLKHDKNENDRNDTIILNELYCGRVDILITEDKKIHDKATDLNISSKVFTINTFLEKVYAENPSLVDYKVLSIRQKLFGDLDINDLFFQSLKDDYPGFEAWFNKKAQEQAYVTINGVNKKILSFLYLKKEGEEESYHDIEPRMLPKVRLKVGTFKVISNGVRLGERFLKIIFDNALRQSVNEIYVTIFDKRDEQLRLIQLMEDWGFRKFGKKNNGELVYVRSFERRFNVIDPKETFPYISSNKKIYLVPIYPDYHTQLLPDSILNTEDPNEFLDSEPHMNSISKVYVTRSLERDVSKGDILIFYRTGGYHKSVVTTLGLVDDVFKKIQSEEEFKEKCRKRTVLSEKQLSAQWTYKKNPPFIINFLHCLSFPKRLNLKALIELGIIKDVSSAPRGLVRISKEQFLTIIRETASNESIIVD